ncbi:antitoxin Xre/MbcA/ParS toxin-binding domain-containing protein [Pseudomonas nitroreducens]|uniref:antitoxin Xre/MbcA/ParS toxin-binding domain-containing protein n=1 Tax=Pseudomonas nitroreducens TaxID=46680 RepID=UPI002FE0978C
MNNLTERRLVTRYRSLLLLPKGSVYFFGFECGDGWADLLEGTLRLIQRYAEEEALDVRIVDAQEKFGQLRMYQRGGDETVELALDITELVSGCICELCGSPGSGWLQTRCDLHSEGNEPETIETRVADENYIMNYAGTLGLVLWYFKADAVRWVQQKTRALGRRRPIEAMATAEGCIEVYTLLKRLEYGVGV